MCVALPTPVVASDALSGLALSQAIRTFKNGWVAVSATGSKSFNRSNGPWPVALVTLKNRTLSPVVERFIECTPSMAKSIVKDSKRASC
jgi:hypothetical protein